MTLAPSCAKRYWGQAGNPGVSLWFQASWQEWSVGSPLTRGDSMRRRGRFVSLAVVVIFLIPSSMLADTIITHDGFTSTATESVTHPFTRMARNNSGASGYVHGAGDDARDLQTYRSSILCNGEGTPSSCAGVFSLTRSSRNDRDWTPPTQLSRPNRTNRNAAYSVAGTNLAAPVGLPEPAGIWFLGSGLLSLGVLLRRRK